MNTIATAPITISPARVLADLLPKRVTRTSALTQDVALVFGFALLTALAAQIEIPLGFTPVPLTGQTFAVLLTGAVLGMRRGALSQLVYWFAGLTGLPFYSGGAGGWKDGTGATLGYLIGFIVCEFQLVPSCSMSVRLDVLVFASLLNVECPQMVEVVSVPKGK